VGADLLTLLQAGGRDQLTATEHHWIDLGAMASLVPAGARRVGFGGLGLLMDAVSEVPATSHLIRSPSALAPAAMARRLDRPARFATPWPPAVT
jgi:hypothetical protein